MTNSEAAAATQGAPTRCADGEQKGRRVEEPEGSSGIEQEGCVCRDRDQSESVQSERALAEHNALARVFDDVRAQSRNGLLVEPTRWPEVGFVPEHMNAEDFEMFVYDYWESHHADEEGSSVRGAATQDGAAPSSRQGGTARRSSLRAVAAVPSSVVPGVGIPPFLRDKAEAHGDPHIGKQDSDADLSPREYTQPAKATPQQSDDVSGSLVLPEGYKLEELEGEWVLVPDDDAKPPRLEVDCDNIVALVGYYSYYLYDRAYMTDAYAHWAFLSAEHDDAVTFVDCVREESRTYPRPMPIETLKNEPFCFSDDRIIQTWDIVRSRSEYADIKQTVASNGDVFFYSTKYLTPEYAASLAEWAAVERLRNV